MDAEERERMNQLCMRLQNEKDHQEFSKLLQELNELLDRKEQRLATAKNSESSQNKPA